MESEDPNPDTKATLVDSFCDLTSSTKEAALFFLESHNFDLDAAVSTFFDTTNTEIAFQPNTNQNDAVVNPSDFPGFNPLENPHFPPRARRNLGKKPSSSRRGRGSGGGSRGGGGDRNLRNESESDSDPDFQPGDDDDDDDEDEDYDSTPWAFNPAGQEQPRMVGRGTDRNRGNNVGDTDPNRGNNVGDTDPNRGNNVGDTDPNRGNNVDDIFDQARESAVDVPLPERSSRSRSFTGAARLLSGETVPSAPQPVEAITRTITFWRNGFSVDDGPLRRLDDPQNAPFLESIRKSECPRELEPADRRTSVHVNLTRRDENYPEPAQPRHLPFRGVGRTLGSSSSNSEAADEPNQTTGASRKTAPVPAMGLVVDDSQPVTSIQLRLADGTRMVSRFNLHHTIRDVRAFIDASRPGGARSYQLQTMGFPPKPLADLDQTIEQAGIANSVVIQKL